MKSVYTSKKIVTNIDGKENYSEEIFEHSNNGIDETTNIVFKQLVYVEGEPYIVSIHMNDQEIKLKIINFETNESIEEIMTQGEIIEYFQNIKEKLPESINKLNRKKISKKTLKREKTESRSSSKGKSASKGQSSSKGKSASKGQSSSKGPSSSKGQSSSKGPSASKGKTSSKRKST